MKLSIVAVAVVVIHQALAAQVTASLNTVGVYDVGTGQWLLRNTNTSGGADIGPFTIVAAPNQSPVAGDWDGDGTDTIGVYRPSTGEWFLRNSNSIGVPDIGPFIFGGGSDRMPVSGDWIGDVGGDVTIPEPASFIMCVVGGGLLMTRRGRPMRRRSALACAWTSCRGAQG